MGVARGRCSGRGKGKGQQEIKLEREEGIRGSGASQGVEFEFNFLCIRKPLVGFK